MERQLIEFLKTLEDSLPSPAGCHHSLTCQSVEGEYKLVLGIWYHDSTRIVYLESGDLAKPTFQLVEEVLEICLERKV